MVDNDAATKSTFGQQIHEVDLCATGNVFSELPPSALAIKQRSLDKFGVIDDLIEIIVGLFENGFRILRFSINLVTAATNPASVLDEAVHVPQQRHTFAGPCPFL